MQSVRLEHLSRIGSRACLLQVFQEHVFGKRGFLEHIFLNHSREGYLEGLPFLHVKLLVVAGKPVFRGYVYPVVVVVMVRVEK